MWEIVMGAILEIVLNGELGMQFLARLPREATQLWQQTELTG